MIITKETVLKLNDLGIRLDLVHNGYSYGVVDAMDIIKTIDEITPQITKFDIIQGFGPDGCYIQPIYNNVAPKKKEITVEWVMNKINKHNQKENSYINLSKIVKDKIKGINAYPTSYGIGVEVWLGKYSQNAIQQVEKLLNDLGVDYKNEHSDARLVYRFIISKAQTNLQKLNA